ncbi:MAG: FAD-dependent oxidoreductase [Endomicrobium sp.]|jgi:thioredoxin reductase (NADPH)|nr:FAD-dependent oxidoreductase [Endomicrobium sp.]
MIYDVIIVGGGPAGLASAIYSSKNKLTTLLIEKASCGGKLANITLLNDYPGFNGGIQGLELATRFEQHARYFGSKIIFDEVVSINNDAEKIKVINTVNKNSYQGRVIIIASGTRTRTLNIIGESQFNGKGVSFCAMCDAQFFKDRDVVVIGNSSFAIKEAIYLSQCVHSVTIISKYHRLSANQKLLNKLFSLTNINILYNTILKKICGTDIVEKVEIYNICTQQSKYINTNGVFISIGAQPNSFFVPAIIRDENDYIITNSNLNTSIKGVYACGDVRQNSIKQVITSVAEGIKAAIKAHAYYIYAFK